MRFVLIDRFLELEPGRRAVARKVFRPEEEVFLDHFPGLPVVPGVLLTEAMGQTAGWLLASGYGFERWPLLVMVEKAKFRRLVRPGEELVLSATVARRGEDDFEARTEAGAGGERVADARLLFHVFDLPADAPLRESLARWGRSTFASLRPEREA